MEGIMKKEGNNMAGKVASISINERREEQFNDTVANIRPVFTEGKGRNQKTLTGSVMVPLSCCYVDMRYQRFRQHRKLKWLDSRWSLSKLTPIVIVPHYEEHRFAIVDGQGRFLVAPKKGMDRLPATVLLDIPEDYNERLKFEADCFIKQDTETENLKDLEKHPGRVILEDKTAICIENMLNAYKVKISSLPGQRETSVLGSYPLTYNIVLTHGGKCLEFIFTIIDNAGWNKEKNGYASYVMRSLRDVWIAHPNDRVKMSDFLSKELRQLTPMLFSSKSRAKYPARDPRVACTLYIEDMLCEGLKLPKKIYIDGEKKCKVIG